MDFVEDQCTHTNKHIAHGEGNEKKIKSTAFSRQTHTKNEHVRFRTIQWIFLSSKLCNAIELKKAEFKQKACTLPRAMTSKMWIVLDLVL